MSNPTYESTTERVQTWLDGTTLHIRFNNPARHNALSVDMWEAVPPLLRVAQADDRVRLVVFSGTGEKAFVSGADISQFEDMRAAREAVTRYEAMAEEALMSIHDFPKPTLACVRGYCIGGGVNVAISCDIRIASDDSVFSIPAARLGLGYRYSAMKNLVDLIGPGAAKDLFFTARRIDRRTRRGLGLVTRVSTVEGLGRVAGRVHEALATTPVPRSGEARPSQREHPEAPAGTGQSLCTSLIRGCSRATTHTEGATAFMQKRKPVFTGR
jgi:enoyl-CoA hydratase/carnithine racemase